MKKKSGPSLDKWFYKKMIDKELDILPPYSTDWIYVCAALKPLFEIINIDEITVTKDGDDEWICVIVIHRDGLTTMLQRNSNSPLGAIMHAAGEVYSNMRENDNGEESIKEKSSEEKSIT